MTGNCTMLIWLGKQYLGQKDNPQPDREELPNGFDICLIDSDGNREPI